MPRIKTALQDLSAILAICSIGFLLAACQVDKHSMAAPSGAVASISAPTTLLVVNSAAPVTMILTAGATAVPDGTEVVFTATRGQLGSQKVRTQNGSATVNYTAPADSGPVQIAASSAEARATLDVAVVSAPVASVKVAASPSVLPSSGGETNIVATVLGPSNQLVSGAPVTFQAGAGTLNVTSAVTDQTGTARARLKTTTAAIVTVNIKNQHSAQVRVDVSAPPAPPTPTPSPSPTPTPSPNPPSPGVPFNLNDVVWLDTDVSDWRVTSTITDVSIPDPPICIDHTKRGKWPTRNGVEGNPWIFANINGTWYAATYEWLRSGTRCKDVSSATIGAYTKEPPLESWRPRRGELVGFMVSAWARSSERTVLERSNIVMVRWP